MLRREQHEATVWREATDHDTGDLALRSSLQSSPLQTVAVAAFELSLSIYRETHALPTSIWGDAGSCVVSTHANALNTAELSTQTF